MGGMIASTPLVSVIIPNLNYGRYLKKAIDSALTQAYSNIEVIVVDDGSSDGSGAVIASFGTRIRACFQENMGPSAARNSGIGLAQGDYLLFLDADDWLLPNAVADLVQGFAAFPDSAIVFGDAELTDEDGAVIGMRVCEMTNVPLASLLRRNPILTLTALVRRRSLESAGVFNPLFRHGEDYDLWLRIARRFPVRHVACLVARRRSHGRQLSGDVIRQLHGELAVKEAFASTGPTPETRSALGDVHHRLAYEYKAAADFSAMWSHSKAAVAHHPWRPKHWLYLGAACLFRIVKRSSRKKQPAGNEKSR
jgi:glycosyltransferase involved in cell wall biosynthesis